MKLISNWVLLIIRGKSEGFDSCDRPSNFTQIGFKLSIFQPVWPWNLPDDVKNNGHLFYATSSFVHHSQSTGELKLELQSRNTKLGSKLVSFFVLYDLEIWQMTLTCDRAPLLCYLKFCTLFCSQRSIQTGVTVQKHLIWVKIRIFVPVWPWNLTDDLEKQ